LWKVGGGFCCFLGGTRSLGLEGELFLGSPRPWREQPVGGATPWGRGQPCRGPPLPLSQGAVCGQLTPLCLERCPCGLLWSTGAVFAPCHHPERHFLGSLTSAPQSSTSMTQTPGLDFLSWSISLPSSCLLPPQNESPSLEVESGNPAHKARSRCSLACESGAVLWVWVAPQLLLGASRANPTALSSCGSSFQDP
jgi:hypothetical protein